MEDARLEDVARHAAAQHVVEQNLEVEQPAERLPEYGPGAAPTYAPCPMCHGASHAPLSADASQLDRSVGVAARYTLTSSVRSRVR